MHLKEIAAAIRAGLSKSGPKQRRPHKDQKCQEAENLAKNEELEVDILERRDFTLPTVDGKEKVEIWITYRFGKLAPALLRLPKKDLTEAKEKAAIRADIQRRIMQQPKKMKV